MGITQGLMSGIMGGTMGPMISVMMFYDHLSIFMPIYIVLNVLVLLFMSRIYYEESVKDNDEVKRVPTDISTTLIIAFIVTLVMSAVILFLPRSSLLSLV
jgi:heme/copper-type cytochrome/quinol oxidase subunit 2